LRRVEPLDFDKKLEAMLKRKVELERLRVEEETILNWKEKVAQSLTIHKDYRSLEITLKKVVQSMDNRLRLLHAQIKELG